MALHPHQTALITGASSGFGADFARQLGERGVNLILSARRAERLQTLKQEILTRFPSLTVDVLPLDLVVPGAPQQLFDESEALGRRVDILINNAGFGLHGTFLQLPLDRQTELVELDVRALIQLSWLFGRGMVERKHGYVLNVSSIATFQPSPDYAVYAASKVAVTYFTRAINHEWRGSGVSATVLAPGTSATEFAVVANQGRAWMHTLGDRPSDFVVRSGLDALFRRKEMVVPGWPNAMMAGMTRFVPTAVAMWFARRLTAD